MAVAEPAYAKINLHLHVTGKRTDGYHLLDSLVCFADKGDRLFFYPSYDFQFEITGPFAGKLTGRDIDTSPSSTNSVIRAAHLLSATYQRDLCVKIVLEKNLPIGAGIGGGSADAAACLRGLCNFWNLAPSENILHQIAVQIGSDVAVCLAQHASVMRGVGEQVTQGPLLPEMHALLIWPNESVPTERIFRNLNMNGYSPAFDFSQIYRDINSLIYDLNKTQNDLERTAQKFFPVIGTALEELNVSDGCIFSRMSGSGSTVFGIFENSMQTKKACEEISARHNEWWVQPTLFNRVSY